MYSLSKFWSSKNEFIILGYSEPKFRLEENWKFISMGQDYGPQSWSNGLINFFTNFEEDYFIYMIDDTVMTRTSDIDKIELAFKYMLENDDVKKCFLQGSLTTGGKSLLGDIEYYPVKDLNNYFHDINQFADYRTSVQSSIWSTNYFLGMLKPNLSPWDFELQHIKNDGYRILTTLENHPAMFGHLFCKSAVLLNDWSKSMYENTQLSEEDIHNIYKILDKKIQI